MAETVPRQALSTVSGTWCISLSGGDAGRSGPVRERELLALDLDGEVAALGLVLRVGVGEARGHPAESVVLELRQAGQDVGRGRYPGYAAQLHGLLEHQPGDPGVGRGQRLLDTGAAQVEAGRVLLHGGVEVGHRRGGREPRQRRGAGEGVVERGRLQVAGTDRLTGDDVARAVILALAVAGDDLAF